MSPSMSCEIPLQFVSFVALAALEGSLHHMRSRVVFGWLDWVEAKLHWLHLNGFSPECVFLCLFSLLTSIVLYSH